MRNSCLCTLTPTALKTFPIIGRGATGKVHSIPRSTPVCRACNLPDYRAIKTLQSLSSRTHLSHEFHTLLRLQDQPGVVRVHATPLTDAAGIFGFRMEELGPVDLAAEGLCEELEAVVVALARRGVRHGDLHWGNVMRDGRGRVTLVDFQHATFGAAGRKLTKEEKRQLRCMWATAGWGMQGRSTFSRSGSGDGSGWRAGEVVSVHGNDTDGTLVDSGQLPQRPEATTGRERTILGLEAVRLGEEMHAEHSSDSAWLSGVEGDGGGAGSEYLESCSASSCVCHAFNHNRRDSEYSSSSLNPSRQHSPPSPEDPRNSDSEPNQLYSAPFPSPTTTTSSSSSGYYASSLESIRYPYQPPRREIPPWDDNDPDRYFNASGLGLDFDEVELIDVGYDADCDSESENHDPIEWADFDETFYFPDDNYDYEEEEDYDYDYDDNDEVKEEEEEEEAEDMEVDVLGRRGGRVDLGAFPWEEERNSPEPAMWEGGVAEEVFLLRDVRRLNRSIWCGRFAVPIWLPRRWRR
jgi:hypothetical protein